MKVQIQKKFPTTPETSGLRRFTEQRLSRSLRRLDHQVRAVHVRLLDESGPNGPNRVACKVTVQLASGDYLEISEADSDARKAVALAAHGSKRRVLEWFNRRRSLRRHSRRADGRARA